jgi:acyl-CoA thioesterase I
VIKMAFHTMYTRRLLPPKSLLRKAISVFFVTLCVTWSGLSGHIFNPAHGADVVQNDTVRILAFGDSLTAGYGLDDPANAFPPKLEAELRERGHDVQLLQAGVSGDTTTGGRSRLEWSLAEKPDAVIVALGGNDALRAVNPAVTSDNIDFIVRRIQRDGIPVLIAGMLAPPNLGRDYGERFNSVFPSVAAKTGALIYPFFLEGVAAVPELNQDDRIHPNIDGVAIIVSRIAPVVEKLIARAIEKRAAKQSAFSGE